MPAVPSICQASTRSHGHRHGASLSVVTRDAIPCASRFNDFLILRGAEIREVELAREDVDREVGRVQSRPAGRADDGRGARVDAEGEPECCDVAIDCDHLRTISTGDSWVNRVTITGQCSMGTLAHHLCAGVADKRNGPVDCRAESRGRIAVKEMMLCRGLECKRQPHYARGWENIAGRQLRCWRSDSQCRAQPPSHRGPCAEG